MKLESIALLGGVAALVGCAANQAPALPAAPADLVAAVNARGANECNDNVARVLAAHGVAAAQLTGLRYTNEFSVHSRGAFITGQTAWVNLQGQQGVGLIHLDESCGPQGVGGDGGFRFAR